MSHDPALLAELTQLRGRLRELEAALVAESDIAPGGEIASEVWRSMVEEAAMFLVVYDRHGRILACNRGQTGYDLSKLIGTQVFQWALPAHHAALRAALERVFVSGEIVSLEAQGAFGERWFVSNLFPIKVGGRIVAVGNVSEDITDRLAMQRQLRESESRWRSLAESVPDSVVVLDLAGRLVSATPPLEAVSPEVLATLRGSDFVVPDHRALVDVALASVRATGAPEEVEVQDAFERRWFLSRIAPLRIEGQITGTISVSRDISERRQREEDLRQREARLRFLLEHLPAVAWTVDTQLRCTSAVGAGLAQLGLQPEQAVGLNLYEYFGVPQNDQSTTAHYRALAGESVTLQHDWGGRTYHALLEPLRDANGIIIGALGVAFDISARHAVEQQVRSDRDQLEGKVAENNRQLEAVNESLFKEREVLQRLLDLHDRDRQLIAYEIHDGIVQDMTGAKMFLESAAEPIRQKGGKLAEMYEHGLQVLGNTIDEARRLINGLRPPALDEFGLIDAIENHLGELQLRSAIEVAFEHDVRFGRLAPVVETAIYRIVQEALNNLWRHSQTSRAEVFVHQLAGHIEIVVRDWGCGFDPATVKAKRFGLLSIRERARLLGGDSTIDSAPGRGTTIRVSLPITDVLLPGDRQTDRFRE